MRNCWKQAIQSLTPEVPFLQERGKGDDPPINLEQE